MQSPPRPVKLTRRAFCRRYHLTRLPASLLTLRYFLAEKSETLSWSTISVYTAAIRMYHLEHGYPDPTHNAPQLHLLLQGIKRTSAPSRQTRQPITTSILLRRSDLSRYHRRLYWAAFTLAFYGFLRVGEPI